MQKLSEAMRQSLLAEQQRSWPRHIAGARQGNPWATLCQHCYGRHPPPRDEICPYDPPGRDAVADRLDRGRAALEDEK